MSKLLIEHGCSADALDTSGRGPLCFALDGMMAELLIDHKANINGDVLLDASGDPSGGLSAPGASSTCGIFHGPHRVRTMTRLNTPTSRHDPSSPSSMWCPHRTITRYAPISLSIDRGNWPVVKLLAQYGASLAPHGRGRQVRLQPFLPAAIRIFNDIDKVRYLLDHGAFLEPSSIKTACEANNDDIIKLLVAYGDAIDFKSLYRWGKWDLLTALVDASSIREWVRGDLLYKHSNVIAYTVDEFGPPAAFFLQHHGMDFTSQTTIKKVLNTSSTAAKTILHALDVRFSPLSHPFDIGWVALIESSPVDWELIWDLIHRGASVSQQGSAHTILSCLLSKSPYHVQYPQIAALLQHGIPVNLTTPSSIVRAPIISVVLTGRWDLFYLFLQCNANVNVFAVDSKLNLFHIIAKTSRSASRDENEPGSVPLAVLVKAIHLIKASPSYCPSILHHRCEKKRLPIDYLVSNPAGRCLRPLLEPQATS